MADRYTRVFESHETGYIKGLPVLFEASSLLFDSKEDSEIAQLKFRSIGKPVRSMLVSLEIYDEDKNPLLENHRFEYMDLHLKRDDFFGTQTPIPVGKCDGKSLKVHLLQAVLEDGTVIDNNSDWTYLSPQETLDSVLSEASTAQYRKIYGSDKKFVPLQSEDLWFCGCGAANHEDEPVCHVCGRAFAELKEGVDPDYLQKETDYRKAVGFLESNTADMLEKAESLFGMNPDYKDSQERAAQVHEQLRTIRSKEAAARLEAQERSRQKKKRFIIGGISAAVAMIALIAFMTVFRPKMLYAKATESMKAEDYTQAKEILTKLGDYNDAADLIKECDKGITYQEAQDDLDKGDYKSAIDKFTEVAGYKQSAKLLVSARTGYAKQLFNQKDFNAAYEQAKQLGDTVYTDDDLKKIIYSYAKTIMSGSDYEEALSIFANLGDYLDCSYLITETKYTYVTKHKNNEDPNTYEYITELVDAGYKDSQKLYKDIYAWKVSFLCLNTSEDDTKTNLTSVSKYDTFYTHFKLSGGAPGASTKWSFTTYWPDGDTLSKESEGECYDGDDLWVNGWYNSPQNGTTGTATVIIYIDGKEMCRTSLTITN